MTGQVRILVIQVFLAEPVGQSRQRSVELFPALWNFRRLRHCHRRLRLPGVYDLLSNFRLLQTALLEFLSAAARARIVATDLFVSSRRMDGSPDTERIQPWRPTRGQNRVAWCRRGTALSQPERDFHILYVAGNRDINRVPSERITYDID